MGKISYDKINILDCKNQKNKENLDKFLYNKIPFMEKYRDAELTVDQLFKLYEKLSKKTGLEISYIFNSKNSNGEIFFTSSVLKRDEKRNLCFTIYASTFDELFKKAIVCIYLYAKKGNE